MKKFKTKLIFVYSVLIVLVVLSLLILVNGHAKNAIVSFIENELKSNAVYVNSYLLSFHRPVSLSLFAESEIENTLKHLSKKSETRITIIGVDGNVMYDSETRRETIENHLYRPEVIDAKKNGTGTSIRYSSTVHSDMLYVATNFGGYYVRTAKPLVLVNRLIESITRNVVISGLIVLVISIAVNLFFSTSFTRPINESIRFIDRFFSGDLNARILNYKDDEIGYLQASINKLAEAIQKRIQDLTGEKDKLATIIESIRDPLALFDRYGKISVHNSAFGRVVGTEREIIGKSYFSIIRNSELNSKIHYAFTRKDEVVFEEIVKGKHYQVYILPFHKEQDEGILLLMQDVTEQKRIQQLKSELVGNLSHELKTPISIIRGYLETIKDVVDDRKTVEQFIEKAIANLERQNAIINDMLKLNKLETTVHGKNEYVSIKSVISQCVDLLGPKIQKKNISLTMDLDACAEPVMANSFLAEEIFFNIIDNAINYNKPGGKIDISAQRNNAKIAVSIEDSGIGIPEDEIDRIFERFYRVDKSRSRETGGTGLGLAIVKHAAILLAWDIDVKSSSNGSKFTITIT